MKSLKAAASIGMWASNLTSWNGYACEEGDEAVNQVKLLKVVILPPNSDNVRVFRGQQRSFSVLRFVLPPRAVSGSRLPHRNTEFVV